MPPRAVQIATIAVASFTISFIQAGAQAIAPADSQTVCNLSVVKSASCAPMTSQEKVEFYTDRTVSARTFLGTGFAAGLAQWKKTPPEWGSGLTGYERRYAAAFAGGFIRHTTEFGVGALLHEDPRFEPSTHNGFAARSTDALHNTLFVRTDDGGHRLAWSRVVASIATGFAVNSWEPRRLHSTHHALVLSLAGVASYATGNLTREFTPDVKRYLFHQLHIRDRM